ncbi:hypothetical protein, partial [Escherichia albertii]|uniref:hypothetical protein n=1 Tax=Escherichia albertii TaxID=208962 RepID=UPI0030C9A856
HLSCSIFSLANWRAISRSLSGIVRFIIFLRKLKIYSVDATRDRLRVDVFTCSLVYLYEHDPDMRFESLKSILGHNSKLNPAALG